MDNLTHSFVGLAAAKAGLERLSPGTTALCLLAANAPDADILVLVGGDRWSYLHHHRGITHSIAGTIALAFALPIVFYFIDVLISRLRKRSPTFNLRGLLIASLIVSATHPLLDWTNNYGVRLLLPWSARWFYGDSVFIIDPFMWLVLGGASFLLTSQTKKQVAGWLALALIPTYLVLFGPTGRAGLTNATALRLIWITVLVVLVILFKQDRARRWGSKIAVASFVIVGLYISSLLLVHVFALRQANVQATVIASQNSEHARSVVAMPTLANPLRWSCAFETESASYRFESAMGDARAVNIVRYERLDPRSSVAMAEATRDRRVQIFLGFARFPVARIIGDDCASHVLVQLADLRYTEPGSSRGTFGLEVPVECPTRASENYEQR
jgi:inner membrane protein